MNTFAIGSLPVHFSVAKLFTFRWQYTQKGYSVPETPFSGTEQAMYRERPPDVPTEAEEIGFGSEIGAFAKNGHLYAPVTAAKQLQTAVGCHQTTANHCKPPQNRNQTTANRHRLSWTAANCR